MKNAYIFDIDSTLSDNSQRVHYILPPEGAIHFNIDELDWQPDWESFYADCKNDKPIRDVARLARDLISAGKAILFVTGRPEKCRKDTTLWLQRYITASDFPILLYMRKNGDYRQDAVVKKEIYETILKDSWWIEGVFEDRTQCVNMWRKLGLTCYQVAEGDY